MNAIDISGLRVRYGALEAVRGIDLRVPQGSLFAFLGPNGAGKSTTLSVLSTLLAPSAGSVLVAGHALGREDDAIRRAIGIVFQQSVLDDLLTVEENLRCRGGTQLRPSASRTCYPAATIAFPAGSGGARTSPGRWSPRPPC